MKVAGHLRIEEIRLLAGQEWIEADELWRFLLISNGAAYWMEPGHAQRLEKGEMLVLAPGIKGVVRASQIGQVLLHRFDLALDLLFGFFTLAERKILEGRAARLGGQAQLLPATHVLSGRFAELVTRDAEEGGLAVRAQSLALVGSFFDSNVSLPASTQASSPSAQQRFKEMISAMPDSEIIHQSARNLASLCRCTARHFHRLFREQFGQPLRARRTELRLLRARQLLMVTDMTVMEIALQSGYRSLSLFNALFKKRFGVTPSVFRKNGCSLRPGTQDRQVAGPDATGAGEEPQ